jgi:hypothetical protein
MPRDYLAACSTSTLRVYRRVDGHLTMASELSCTTGDELTSPLFPGLTLRLAQLFERTR